MFLLKLLFSGNIRPELCKNRFPKSEPETYYNQDNFQKQAPRG
ncbi:Uncharacterized protein dnm_091240 [Desulfonema magnum]|uniref:Uncharacterized protein n=1 Tax=Desulfonema magnum TaxID=45655 RepID=A0A975GTG0_9BACT|nr:Uncharacterized protein dnm_091240 [Desulfonema magnum]